MSTAPRAWRVITTRNDDQLQCSVATVQAFHDYDLALHAYSVALEQYQTDDTGSICGAELRDPNDICILDSHWPAPSYLKPLNDGLDSSGLYLWHDQAERYHRLP